ncbi:MAG: hypothetical protein C0402_12040 [Thermodesulfovibrio sp.]|nr:hypothetical protein [Thermodesulfovibrio sp.]
MERKAKNMSPETSERREYFRLDLANVVELVTADADSSDQFRGVTINISETGMSLFVFQPVKTHDTLLIKKSILPLCHRTGSVRWVQRLAPEIYKIGIRSVPVDGASNGLSYYDMQAENSLHPHASPRHT